MNASRRTVGGIIALMVAGVIVVRGSSAVQATRARREFSSLLTEINGLRQADASARSGGSVLVLVRDVTGADNGAAPRYRVKPGLHWNVPIARSAADVGMVVLVDRIPLDIRSYYPAGDDYQIILHCRVMDWHSRHVVADFTVRGPRPLSRQGWLAWAGKFGWHGSEPWDVVGERVAPLVMHPLSS